MEKKITVKKAYLSMLTGKNLISIAILMLKIDKQFTCTCISLIDYLCK